MLNRRHIKRLEDAARGDVESFELSDGSRYTYNPKRVHEELFLCALGLQLGEVGEPAEIFEKLCEARDPAIVLERFEPDSPAGAIVNLAKMYDREILLTERRLVPLVAEAPEELFE